MKILTITEYASLTGGAKTFVDEITKILSQKGHEVHLIEGSSSPRFKKEETVNGVKIYRYFIRERWFFEINLSIAYETIKITKRLLKKIKFDVIYLHLYSPPFIIFLTNLAPKTPKILHFYGALYEETFSRISKPKSHKVLGKWKRMIEFGPKILSQKFIQAYSLKRADKIVALSQYCQRLIINKFNIDPQKIIVAPGGIDPRVFYPLSPKEKLSKRQELGFAKNANLLLIASRMEPRKGIDNAIKAMPDILKSYPKTLLLIVSPAKSCVDQSYLSQYYDLVSELQLGGKVLFLTGLSREKLTPYYQIADCFLMVSRDLETFGLTTIESLACGTPVLGTRAGATPEILKPLDRRFVLRSIGPKAITNKVNWLFSLPKKERQILSKKSALYSRKKYSWGKSIKNLEAFINSILKIKKGTSN